MPCGTFSIHYILNTVVTFEMVELSLENRKTWFTQFSEGRYQLFVAEEAEKVIGYAASLRFHQRPAYAPSVMSSIYLNPEHTGKGIGEKLYKELIDNLGDTEEVHRIYGLVVLPNPGSENLHEKMGFQVAGLLHEGWLQIWSVSRCPYVRTSSKNNPTLKDTADSQSK